MTEVAKEFATQTTYEDDVALRILLDRINLAGDRSDLSTGIHKLIFDARQIVLDAIGDQD